MWLVLILQPRPVNHDLLTTTCVFPGFWTNQKGVFDASTCTKMKILENFIYGKSYFIYILDKKTIQNGILSTGCHLILFKNFYYYVLLII